MTDRPPVSNLIDMQRAVALKMMGDHARALLQDGYAVEADRVLDEMIERKRSWTEEAA